MVSEVYTPADVALELGVSLRTVQGWCQAGRLGFKLAGRWRIPRKDVERFLLADVLRKGGSA